MGSSMCVETPRPSEGLWVIQACPGFRFRKQTLRLGRNCSFPAKAGERMESVGECLSCNLFIAVSIWNHYWMIIIKLKCLLLYCRFLFMLPCLYFAVIWGGFWWALSVGQPTGHPGFPTPESSGIDPLLLEMPCWSGTQVPSSLSSQASPSSPHTSPLLLKNTRSNSQDSVENIFLCIFPRIPKELAVVNSFLWNF